MPIDTIFKTLDELRDLRPDFISVTFGAGGSENCDNALAIAKRIQDECKVESVIHMPAINMTKDDAQFCLEQFQNAGIENILGLKVEKGILKIEPCIPEKWEEYIIKYRYKTSIYNIKIRKEV